MPACIRAKKPENVYTSIKKIIHKRIRLPLLKSPQRKNSTQCQYTVKGLSLCFFASNLDKVVTKQELIAYMKKHGLNVSDPQPRHLGLQNGFNFLIMGSYHPRLKRVLKQGEYCLRSLTQPHPSFKGSKQNHRQSTLTPVAFQRLKRASDHRCAHCGSKENEKHFKNKTCITVLERGHMDPRLMLTPCNCIPMCQICNKVYKNKAVFNKRGFVTKWLG